MKMKIFFSGAAGRCVKIGLLSILVLLPVLLCGCTGLSAAGYAEAAEAAHTQPAAALNNQMNEGDEMQNSETARIDKVLLSEIESAYMNVKDYGAAGDGSTDDTAAVRKAMEAAYAKNATVYFPSGSYLISETIQVPKNDARVLVLKGDGDSTIIGAETLADDMFRVFMKYNFQMIDLRIEHRGTCGSLVSAVYLRAFNCTFISGRENPSNAVTFHGSDSKIDGCTFAVSNPEAYAVYYSMLEQEISINDYIVDNHFTGTGRGILVGDGRYTSSGRSEGLKINGNIFENTGDSQIVIQEILHVDIAGNKMSGSSASAIVLRSAGHGPDGIFINRNEITAAFSCIRTEGAPEAYISMVSVSDNQLTGGRYGFYDTIGVNKGFMRDNLFEGQSEAGVYLEETKNMLILSNTFVVSERALSLDVSGSGYTVIAENALGRNNKIALTGACIVQET